ncbi:MAG: class I SAM-dependent methyltransferase [Lutimonas sp.]
MKKEDLQSVLGHDQLEIYLESKDYSVSKEPFTLMLDKQSDLLITHPKPLPSQLPKYYESDAYISHTDGNQTIIERVYQMVKGIAIKNKVRLVGNWIQEEELLLDVGCGTGDFLKACVANKWNGLGIEPNNAAKNLAIQKLGLERASAIFSNLEELLEKNNSKQLKGKFSVITLWHVLEHVPEPLDYLKKLKDLLKPNGRIILALPNYKSHDAVHYGNFWAAYDLPRHLFHFSKKSVSFFAGKANMKVENVLPMPFDAFYVSLLSEKYAKGKTNYFAALYRGIVSNRKAKSSGEYSSLIYILKTEQNSI